MPVQFLTKQTATLKGVNESRVRIYEQIETSLSELEENHTKLTEESAWEKAKVKRWGMLWHFLQFGKHLHNFQFEWHCGDPGEQVWGASEASWGGWDKDAGQKKTEILSVYWSGYGGWKLFSKKQELKVINNWYCSPYRNVSWKSQRGSRQCAFRSCSRVLELCI